MHILFGQDDLSGPLGSLTFSIKLDVIHVVVASRCSISDPVS